MPFIGQFRLDNSTDEIRLAYVFMSDLFIFDMEDERADGQGADDEEDESDDYAIGDTFEPEGGEPVWLQRSESPGPGWRLIGQLTDRLGHNFGDAGSAYMFVSPDGTEGRFLWQCH